MRSVATPIAIAALAGACLPLTAAAQLTGPFPAVFELSSLNGTNVTCPHCLYQ